MINISSDILQAWLIGLLMPLTRILGFISVAPLLSHRAIPKRIKLGLGLLLSLIVAPTLTALPAIDLLSLQGLLIIAQQMIIGIAMGFMMTVIFAAIDMAGQVCGMTMGLGFASFFDPQSQGTTVVISQFFGVLGLLVFLSLDGHLLMISALVESFQSFPISLTPSGINGMKIAQWGSKIFSIGLQLALPVIAALLITNIALGILTRTAPQLNLFGIGFPITIGIGFLVISLMLPSMALPLQQFIQEGILAVRQVGGL